MDVSTRLIMLLLTPVMIAGCGSSPGPDSLSSHKPSTPASGCTAVCHNAQSTVSPDPLPNGKHAKHVNSLGMPCERCHFNYENNALHANGTRDTATPAALIVFFDSLNPGGSWVNDTGLDTGGCSNLACHGTDAPDWYGAGWVLPPCSVCHGGAIGARRQIVGTGGDFAINPAMNSHHISGGNDPLPAQCRVCHDMSHHGAGTVHLRNADTGARIVYDSAHPSSLEPFCLSCHDPDGASGNTSPFADGRTLGAIPNSAGNKIEEYWNSSSPVHKNNGLTCAGSGAPGTGCHGSNGTLNMHGSLSKGLLTRNLTLPIPAGSPYHYDDFKLCFDCHENYPAVSKEVVLGYRQGGNYDLWWAPTPYYTSGIQSLFRDRYIPGDPRFYSDTIWGDPYTPLHNYHLSYTDGWMQNVWNYRGAGNASNIGRASCITCHNVHGTSGSIRSTYAEFGITTGQAGGDEYQWLEPIGNYEDIVLQNYPIYCNISCHSMAPGTYYWHTPADE